MGRKLAINALEPTVFGWQHVGGMDFYLPSPESISTECERIQESWSSAERRKRLISMPRKSASSISIWPALCRKFVP
jgi:hypothetical protein